MRSDRTRQFLQMENANCDLPVAPCRYPTAQDPAQIFAKGTIMLYTIAVILVVLWLLGLVTAYTMGGFIHILLVVAIIAVLLRVINGRTPL